MLLFFSAEGEKRLLLSPWPIGIDVVSEMIDATEPQLMLDECRREGAIYDNAASAFLAAAAAPRELADVTRHTGELRCSGTQTVDHWAVVPP